MKIFLYGDGSVLKTYFSVSATDQGPHESYVSFGSVTVGLQYRSGDFACRLGFAGETAFVYGQIYALEKPDVGRHPVSHVQMHDISRD